MTNLALTDSPLDSSINTVVVGLAADGSLSPTLKAIDEATEGWIRGLVDAEQLRGKQGEVSLIASPIPSSAGSSLPTMILVVGTGDEELGRGDAFRSGQYRREDAVGSTARKNRHRAGRKCKIDRPGLRCQRSRLWHGGPSSLSS